MPSDSLNQVTDLVIAGDYPEARRLCVRLLRTKKHRAGALHLLGAISAMEGDLPSADSFLRQALKHEPKNSSWYQELSAIRIASGDFAAALKSLSSHWGARPNDPNWLRLQAMALRDSGQIQAAVKVYEQWVELDPESADAWLGQGRCLISLRLLDAAEAHAHLAFARHPVVTHQLFAEIYNARYQPCRALAQRREVVKLLPADPEALVHYALALAHLGDTDASIHAFRQALAGSGAVSFHSKFLPILLHWDQATAEMVLAENRRWASLYGTPPNADLGHLPRRKGVQTRLRIAYLCSESLGSPIARFITPLLRHHNQDKFDVAVYGTNPALLQYFGKECSLKAAQLRNISFQSTAAVVRRMRRDKVDILVDFSGHHGEAMPLIIAFRAAPVQVSFPHYPSTTGLPQMDYIFSDRWTCPPDQASQYSEKPYWLDSGYIVFDPVPDVPDPGPLPALQAGFVTFGIFQRPAKISRRCWEAMGEILRRVPHSRLLIHHASAELDEPASEARSLFIKLLSSGGFIDPARILFRGVTSLLGHVRLLAEVDIALDSFPYTGTTTTCDCLWMGVPVVTLAGNRHAARVSTSVLTRAGLAAMAASTIEDYVQIATELASDLGALATLRRGMRQRVRSSTLVDGVRLTADVESAYQWMWQQLAITANP